jgi:hypothetical protein
LDLNCRRSDSGTLRTIMLPVFPSISPQIILGLLCRNRFNFFHPSSFAHCPTGTLYCCVSTCFFVSAAVRHIPM